MRRSQMITIFAIGGDSILSLQLVSRARQSGFELTPRQVFEHPTPRGMAEIATHTIRPPARVTACVPASFALSSRNCSGASASARSPAKRSGGGGRPASASEDRT